MQPPQPYPPNRVNRTAWIQGLPIPAPPTSAGIFKPDERTWITTETNRLLATPALWVDSLMNLIAARQQLFEVPVTRSGVTGVIGHKFRVQFLATWFSLDHFASRLIATNQTRQAGDLLRERPYEAAVLQANSYIGAAVAGMIAESEGAASTAAADLPLVDTREAPLNSSDVRVCPWCAEHIKSRAVICRFCNRDVAPIPESASRLQLDDSDVARLQARYGELVVAVLDELAQHPDATGRTVPASVVEHLCDAVEDGTAAEIRLGELLRTLPTSQRTSLGEESDPFEVHRHEFPAQFEVLRAEAHRLIADGQPISEGVFLRAGQRFARGLSLDDAFAGAIRTAMRHS